MVLLTIIAMFLGSVSVGICAGFALYELKRDISRYIYLAVTVSLTLGLFYGILLFVPEDFRIWAAIALLGIAGAGFSLLSKFSRPRPAAPEPTTKTQRPQDNLPVDDLVREIADKLKEKRGPQ